MTDNCGPNDGLPDLSARLDAVVDLLSQAVAGLQPIDPRQLRFRHPELQAELDQFLGDAPDDQQPSAK